MFLAFGVEVVTLRFMVLELVLAELFDFIGEFGLDVRSMFC
jgi:hypothetical protein